jgi:hypothetical protein
MDGMVYGKMVSSMDGIMYRAVAQVVSRPMIAEGQIHIGVSAFGICGERSGTRTGFSQSSSVLTVDIIPPWLYISSATIGPLLAAVQRHRLTPSTGTTITL